MKRLFLTLAIVVLASPLAQGEGPLDETRTTLRYHVLNLINRDRQSQGLPPVQLDAQASAIADAYCTEQIRNRTSGHFSTDGLAPYMRYSFSGGNDGVSENAAAWSANYGFGDRALYEMATRSEAAMMAEKPPHDGHRKTLLDPYATHVGIGLAWEKGEFRLAHEFVRRYVSWKHPLPRTATTGELVTASGTPLGGAKVEAISVHYEAFPQPMPAHVANSIDSYSLPDRRKDYLPRLDSYYSRRPDGTILMLRREYEGGGKGDFRVSEDDGSFAFDIPFTEGDGVYTVVVWVRPAGGGAPVAASNVSIRVVSESSTAYAGAGTR
ncbi:MAG TPA: CAP domain-containing protein [Thermoanaerobaculia bacterium]|nr:CAP domain-containing protein [Thermoanaerobaculia bacterium]